MIPPLVILSIVVVWILRPKPTPIQTSAQDSSRGLLALNTDKALYKLGDKVYIQMAALDEKGNTLCDAPLSLVVNSQPLEISKSPTCSPDNNVTNSPDYTAFFTPQFEGQHTLVLSDSQNQISADFEVSKTPRPLSVSRWSATRANPFKSDRYPMVITVTANRDYRGEFIEQLPPSFSLPWTGPAKLSRDGEKTSLTWPLDLKSGQSVELKYEYSPPRSTPNSYTFGNLEIENYLQIGKLKIENSNWHLLTNNNE